MKLGFVGLGTMGAPMAGHLLRAGRQLRVWNRTASKAEPLRKQGAEVASSLRELSEACEVVFLCVNRTEDVESCLREMFDTARHGTLFVDHSTIAALAAERLHGACKARLCRFVDAPITGGSAGAQNGTLTIFCGGTPEDVADALPFMGAYAKKAERVGGPGAGQMMKMANQIAVAGALLALCESMAFAKKAGLNLAQAHEMIGGGAAGSWAFENYGPKILNEDWSPGFSVANQRKDLAYCMESARAIDVAVPGVELVDGLLARLVGRESQTTAALYDALLQMGYGAPEPEA